MRLPSRTADRNATNNYWAFLLAAILQTMVAISNANLAEMLRVQRMKLDEFDAYAKNFLLPQDFDLAEKMPVDRPSPAAIDSMQNDALFEGDIVGLVEDNDPTLAYHFDGDYNTDESSIFGRPYHSSLNTDTYPDKLWKGGRVPYVLEENMTDSQRAAIAQAFDEYKQKTCIRFVPKEKEDTDYIYVKRNAAFGCSSYVGRAGGNQTVSLEIGKCFAKGIIAHELMHSIGFFHEHSRTDRDQFVHIEENNVRNGMLRNFEKYPRKIIDSLTMPYDYESVMHYHKLAFSKNGKPTIQPVNPAAEIGQRYKLSTIDAMKVNKLYKCDTEFGTISTTETPITTTSEEEFVSEEVETTTKEDEEEFYVKRRIAMRRKGGQVTTESTPTMATAFSITNILLPAISLPREIYHIISGTSVKGRTYITSTPQPNSSEEEEEEEEKSYQTITSPRITTKIPLLITLSIFPTHAPLRKMRPASIESVSSTTNVGNCEDKNSHCEMWERLGHCDHSVKYMQHYCRKACGFCDTINSENESKSSVESTKKDRNTKVRTACLDRNLFCGYWARIGECNSESKFMKIFCKRSCGNCEA